MIPKIIHKIWFQGYENIPKNLLQYHKECVKIHKNYKFIVWDKQSIEKLVNKQPDWIRKTYYSYESIIQKIDFAKYIILYTYGGVYMDIDIKCIKTIDLIFEKNIKANFIISTLPIPIYLRGLYVTCGLKKWNDIVVNNGIIFTSPKHQILKLIMKRSSEQINNKFKNINNLLYICTSTGPLCVTRALGEYGYRNDVVILDYTYFEPCPDYRNCNIPEYSVGIHIYEQSWMSKSDTLLIRVYVFLYHYFIYMLIIIIAIIAIAYFYKYSKILKNKHFYRIRV